VATVSLKENDMLRLVTKPIRLLRSVLSLPFAALRLAEKPARIVRRQRPAANSTAPNVSFSVYAPIIETDQARQDTNRWLEAEVYPPPDQWRGGGGGGMVTVGKVVIDGHGSGGRNDDRRSSYKIEAGSGQGGMQIGVLLLDMPFVRVYPLMGIGGTGGEITLAPQASNNGSEPRRTGWFALMINGGIGADVRLSLRWLQLWIGLRMGYHVPALNVQIGAGEEIGVQARPFFRVLVGTGLKPPER
jgi:hypothetical protein